MADVIHKTPRSSIYERTDYYVNSDMSIPDALAFTWNYGVATESERRIGLPTNNRQPEFTPLVLAPPKIPKGK